MADDEALGGTPRSRAQRGKAEADGVEPHQVDVLREQPARVVFAKAGRLDQRQPLEIGRVRLQDRRAAWGSMVSSPIQCSATTGGNSSPPMRSIIRLLLMTAFAARRCRICLQDITCPH